MRRTRSAILALSLLGVVPDAAWAQVGLPPTDPAVVSATVGVSAEAPAAEVTADMTAAAAGRSSGAASVDAAATVRTADVGASAGARVAADGAGGPEVALAAAVGTETSPHARRPAAEPASDEAPAPPTRANERSSKPDKAKAADARARAERTRAAQQPVTRPVADVVERASLPLEAPVDPAPSAPREAENADSNAGGPSPHEAAPPTGGASAVATLLSLAVLLIPLASWAIEHAAAGSPRRAFLSLLERPG